MLYIIGLGLNEKSLSVEALEAVKKCSKAYLEAYTVDFPYSINDLEENIGKKILKLEREDVESSRLLREAKKEGIALLIYGSPLFATTHISLLLEAKKQKIKTKIIFNASVFDAVSSCGLELYKFGKITSLPDWKDKGKSMSFTDVIKENIYIKAHSLILIDIGLSFEEAKVEIKEAAKEKSFSFDKIVVCSQLGTEKEKIFYGFIDDIPSKSIKLPFCFVIPGNSLHFTEKESLEGFSVK